MLQLEPVRKEEAEPTGPRLGLMAAPYIKIVASGVLLLALAWLAFAQKYQIVGNLRYAPYGETVLDIMQPPRPALADRPGVLAIHGGGWVGGSKADMGSFCTPFIDHGFVVANVEYRLASSAPAPAAVTDVLTAARYLADNAGQYKVNPSKLIATGFSAGGHLALLAGLLPEGSGLGPYTRFAAVIDFYGITDVAQQVAGPGRRDYAVEWIPPGPQQMVLAKRLSPLTYVRKDVPPVLVIHGDADDVVPYEQSVRLVNALKQAGARAELLTVPGGKHGFTDAQLAKVWPEIFRWLKKMKVG